MTTMSYKGYEANIEYDEDAGIFHGEVADLRDVITFQGKSVAELKKALAESIEDYLAFCKERGEEPDKPFAGQFVVRTAPSLIGTCPRLRGGPGSASISGLRPHWKRPSAGSFPIGTGPMPSPGLGDAAIAPTDEVDKRDDEEMTHVAAKQSTFLCCRMRKGR
jgi:predicted HicB family RNase H-like nuclease